MLCWCTRQQLPVDAGSQVTCVGACYKYMSTCLRLRAVRDGPINPNPEMGACALSAGQHRHTNSGFCRRSTWYQLFASTASLKYAARVVPVWPQVISRVCVCANCAAFQPHAQTLPAYADTATAHRRINCIFFGWLKLGYPNREEELSCLWEWRIPPPLIIYNR